MRQDCVRTIVETHNKKHYNIAHKSLNILMKYAPVIFHVINKLNFILSSYIYLGFKILLLCCVTRASYVSGFSFVLVHTKMKNIHRASLHQSTKPEEPLKWGSNINFLDFLVSH